MEAVEFRPRIDPDQPSSQLVLVDTGEGVDIDALEPAQMIGQIMDPARVTQRAVLRDAALFKYPGYRPQDLREEVAYLAATGKEVKTLYPRTDEFRIANLQFDIVKKIAEGEETVAGNHTFRAEADNRFRAGHPHYDNDLRQALHNDLRFGPMGFPNIPEVLRSVGISPDGKHKIGLSVQTRDAVLRMLYDKYPYFPDALAAAHADGYIDDTFRSSLDLLYTENRIADMYGEIQGIRSHVFPGQSLPIFERERLDRLVGHVDPDGNVSMGQFGKALIHHAYLSDATLPQSSLELFRS